MHKLHSRAFRAMRSHARGTLKTTDHEKCGKFVNILRDFILDDARR